MALTDENGGMNTTMLVSPTNGYPVYQGGGFGNSFGDNGSWWILLLFILLLGGNWNNNGNGNGGYFGTPYVVDNSVQRGFDQSSIMNGINDITGSICNGFSNVQQSLCNGFAGVNATVNSGFATAEASNNARQIADMQQMFGLQSQLAQCCCDNRLATANLQSVIQTENCADRQVVSDGIRDLLVANNANTQRILDTMCQDKIDAKNEKIADLERQLTMANLQASQTAQNAFIAQGFSNEVDALYDRLNSCPVPTTPVYGRTPIFTCNNNGCGCGCSGNF